MSYDSEEAKKKQERMAELLKSAREFMNDKETMNILKVNFKMILDFLERLKEKERIIGKLDEDDMELLVKANEAIATAAQVFSDMKLIIGNEMVIQGDALYFHIKKLAEEGNEDAKKAHAILEPKYKKILMNESSQERAN